MATDMFLVIPEIPGESRDAQFLKSIAIESVTYGMSAPGSPTEPVSGKPSVDQIVVAKYVDSASLPCFGRWPRAGDWTKGALRSAKPALAAPRRRCSS